MSKVIKRIVSILIIAVLIVCCTACGGTNAVNLMAGIKCSKNVTKTETSADFVNAEVDFSIRMFKEALQGDENVLLSPLSVMTVFAMIANGAKENTLAEIEAAMGDISIAELNEELGYYIDNLYSSKNSKLKVSNSLWYEKSVAVKRSFLQKLADSYDPDVYQVSKGDDVTKALNAWVKKKTDGMIDKLFDGNDADDFAVILANAIAFDAKWASKFEKENGTSTFTSASGEEHNVSMMHSESETYIESDNAHGFIKNYKDGKYSFMAVMPKNGMDISSYITNFSSDEYMRLIKSSSGKSADVRIPKFKVEYKLNLNDTLKSMGIRDAFNEQLADFTDMAERSLIDGNLYIDIVMHRTFIEVDENGTKAAAVTGAGLKNEAFMPNDIKLVFDRPFIYAIVDNQTGIPIFIGADMDIA